MDVWRPSQGCQSASTADPDWPTTALAPLGPRTCPTLQSSSRSQVRVAGSAALPLPSQTPCLECLSRLLCRADLYLSFRSPPSPRTCLAPTPAPDALRLSQPGMSRNPDAIRAALQGTHAIRPQDWPGRPGPRPLLSSLAGAPQIFDEQIDGRDTDYVPGSVPTGGEGVNKVCRVRDKTPRRQLPADTWIARRNPRTSAMQQISAGEPVSGLPLSDRAEHSWEARRRDGNAGGPA